MSSADARAEYLLDLTTRLAGAVAGEARRLDAGALAPAGPDWEEKEHLVHTYRIEIARAKANPAELAGVSPGLRDRLAAAARALEESLAVHAAALAAKREVTDGLVRAIAAEAASQRAAPSGYTQTGRMAEARTSQAASGLALNARA